MFIVFNANIICLLNGIQSFRQLHFRQLAKKSFRQLVRSRFVNFLVDSSSTRSVRQLSEVDENAVDEMTEPSANASRFVNF